MLRARRVVAIGVAVVALLAGGVAGIARIEARRHDEHVAVAAAANRILRFDERTRGLHALHPVDVHLTSQGEFRRRLRTANRSDAAATEATTATLVALRLVPPTVDLRREVRTLLDAAVVGFYDPRTRRLYVRGGRVTPFTRVTLAHELTHALQDQNFGLRKFDKLRDEAQAAVTALIEGDAVRVEQAYAQTLSAKEQLDYQIEAGRLGGSDAGVPPVLTDLLTFPYVAGPDFIEALEERGGNAQVDSAFRAPPQTTAQILHPDLYFEQTTPLPGDQPPAPAKVEDKGQLGEYGLRLVLGKFLDRPTAQAAAAGWGTDRYVTWRDGQRDHTIAIIEMANEREAIELQAALDRWAQRAGAARVTRDRAKVTLDVLGPRRRLPARTPRR